MKSTKFKHIGCEAFVVYMRYLALDFKEARHLADWPLYNPRTGQTVVETVSSRIYDAHGRKGYHSALESWSRY